MQTSVDRWARALVLGCTVLCAFAACGGGSSSSGAQQSPRAAPYNPDDDEPQATVTKDGKSVWPPVGPGCEKLVACCNDAARGRPTVDLACQLSAVKPDCVQGRKAVIEILDDEDASVPASCR